MIISHYSDKNFKGKIEPKYFGSNSYTQNSVKEASIARSFFYIGRGREYFLNGAKYRYTAEIDNHKIYNLEIDNKNLKAICKNFEDILKRVKFLGYRGIRGNNGYDIVCLFYPLKYTNKRVI